LETLEGGNAARSAALTPIRPDKHGPKPPRAVFPVDPEFTFGQA
jgi:hypothetical protein